MRSVHLYVSDALGAELDRLTSDVNLSALFQEAARAEISRQTGCKHPRIVCADCGAHVGP